MAGDVMDRRVRKTRGTLRACLTKLLKEKKIKEISVKEISEMADINRGTFYLHYRDVFDLLESIENDMFRQFTEILDRHASDEVIEAPEKLLTDILTFIKENADLTMILLGPNGDAIRSPTRWLLRSAATSSWTRGTGAPSSPKARSGSSRYGLRTGRT